MKITSRTSLAIAAVAVGLIALGASYGLLQQDFDPAKLTTLYTIPASGGLETAKQYNPLGMLSLASIAAAIALVLTGAFHIVRARFPDAVPSGSSPKALLPWNWEAGLGKLKREIGRVDGVVEQLTAASASHAASLTAANELLVGETSAKEVSAIVDNLLSENQRLRGECTVLLNQLGEKHVEKREVEAALEKAQHEQALDPLSGLGNRRTFDKEIQDAIAAARETGTPLSLIMADIDHFKPINDTHGHTVGDEVIKALAGVIAVSLRKTDIATRYGGEEFAIIMPKVGLETAKSVAERIRKKWASRKLTLRASGKVIGPITASFGVAELRVGETAETLIGRADRKLYAAKSAGRNRVMG